MSNEKRFSYLLVAALAASFSTDAAAQESNDLLDLDTDGEWRPAEVEDRSEHSSIIETENGWGVEIDRVRFHGEGFDVELEARGRVDDLKLVLQPDDIDSSPEVREVANWLDHSLSGGDRLYRRMNDQWSFSGRLYAPGVDGRPGQRSVAIEGELPLEVEVARNQDDPSVVVDIAVPRDVFEVDWKTFRDSLEDA